MKWKLYLRNFAIGVVVLFMAVAVYDRWTITPEVRAYAEHDLVPMNAASLQTLLNTADRKPTLIFIYASWCPYCKEQFKILAEMRGRLPAEKLNIAYVSIDSDRYAASRFLMRFYPKKPFTPYYAGPEIHDELYDEFKTQGFKPTTGIPYLLLFDKGQKRANEYHGVTEAKTLIGDFQRIAK